MHLDSDKMKLGRPKNFLTPWFQRRVYAFVSIFVFFVCVQLITVKGLGAVTANKSTVALLLALVMTLLNQLSLEPIATKNMMRRYELDNVPGGQETEEYKKLKASFGKFHGISSLTNLIALCAAVAHGFFLSGAFLVK